jgi:hypothetical protein
MKKLILVAIVFLSVNSAFALSENSTSDCQSLSSSTSDADVSAVGSSQEEVGSGSTGVSQ